MQMKPNADTLAHESSGQGAGGSSTGCKARVVGAGKAAAVMSHQLMCVARMHCSDCKQELASLHR